MILKSDLKDALTIGVGNFKPNNSTDLFFGKLNWKIYGVDFERKEIPLSPKITAVSRSLCLFNIACKKNINRVMVNRDII